MKTILIIYILIALIFMLLFEHVLNDDELSENLRDSIAQYNPIYKWLDFNHPYVHLICCIGAFCWLPLIVYGVIKDKL